MIRFNCLFSCFLFQCKCRTPIIYIFYCFLDLVRFSLFTFLSIFRFTVKCKSIKKQKCTSDGFKILDQFFIFWIEFVFILFISRGKLLLSTHQDRLIYDCPIVAKSPKILVKFMNSPSLPGAVINYQSCHKF